MVERIPLKQVMSSLNVPAVIALGHPLLDILVTLENHELWEKFNLPFDEALELPYERIQELIDNIPSSAKQTLAAGGCAQNTLRILQWLLDQTNSMKFCLYSGCLGKDSRGIALREIVEASGVQTRYAIHPTLHTGICVSLIRNSLSTLVVSLGAAGVYTLDDLKNNEIPFDHVQILYIEGFFITHSLDVAKYLTRKAKTKNIIITFNLNGEYIFKDHHREICEMVRLSKIIFGNAKEMSALAKAFNLKFEDVNDVPFLLNKFFNRHSSSGNWLTDESTTFVMTQGGSAPAIVVWGQGESAQVQPMTRKDPIVDTTGAGDSLVAGFLAGILARWNPKDCLEFGCKVASFTITLLGVTLPNDVPNDLII